MKRLRQEGTSRQAPQSRPGESQTRADNRLRVVAGIWVLMLGTLRLGGGHENNPHPSETLWIKKPTRDLVAGGGCGFGVLMRHDVGALGWGARDLSPWGGTSNVPGPQHLPRHCQLVPPSCFHACPKCRTSPEVGRIRHLGRGIQPRAGGSGC